MPNARGVFKLVKIVVLLLALVALFAGGWIVGRLGIGSVVNPASLTEESHGVDHDGLLEYPLYSKPPSWRGLDVPEILFSGHHGKIAEWRREQALARTRERRPDLVPDEPEPQN